MKGMALVLLMVVIIGCGSETQTPTSVPVDLDAIKSQVRAPIGWRLTPLPSDDKNLATLISSIQGLQDVRAWNWSPTDDVLAGTSLLIAFVSDDMAHNYYASIKPASSLSIGDDAGATIQGPSYKYALLRCRAVVTVTLVDMMVQPPDKVAMTRYLTDMDDAIKSSSLCP